MIFKPRFIFRGNAFGLGGQIREPYMPYFEVQAASSLPTVGGLSRAEAKGRDFSKLLSFGHAKTEASGGVRRERDPKNNTTIVQAEVFDLLVEGRFSVERTIMSMRSYEQHGDEFPHMIPEQTAIDGITIDGCKVEVVLDPEPFVSAPTKRDVREKYRKDSRWRKEHAKKFYRPEECKFGDDDVFESKGLILATIVKEIIVHHDENCRNHSGKLEVADNTIKVPNFGTAFFGELIISDYDRRLSAIRMQLGSPMQADLEACGLESNGGFMP